MIDGPVLQSSNVPFDEHRRDHGTPRDSAPATLLVAENDVKVAVPLVIGLQEEGYTVLHAVDGHWALELTRAAHPDLILLDVRLPRMDGLAVCRTLRQGSGQALRRTSTVPIILLTAPEQERERIRGLDLGADACLVKPFDFRELLSRIAVVLQRCDPGNGNGTPSPGSIVVGDIILDRVTRQVWQAGRPIHLRRREFDLLSVLMENAGKAVPRRELLNRVWGKGWVGNPRTLDVHICWLREKLEEEPSTPRYIQTLRGYGHRFVEPAGVGSGT